jgi:organic radical activating enzyme
LPNIVLTSDCNNSCEFCFAEKTRNSEFKFEQVGRLYQFIKGFNEDGINIVGGEPTLNKDFLEIITFFLNQNQEVTVFTNGNINEKLVDDLKFLSGNSLLFCVNRSKSQKTSLLTDFYKKLGYMIMLTVTIFRNKQELQHIIDEINAYKLIKKYRLGIALPSWPARTNLYIHPDNYGEISSEIFEFIKQGLSSGIKPSFDCGFPYCFFDENQKNFLAQQDIDFKSNCGIIPDICPDDSVVPCLPLRMISQTCSKNSKWGEIHPLIEAQLRQFKKLPLFEKCLRCGEISNGNCSGGCASFRLVM